MHNSSQSHAEFCITLLWMLNCDTRECCDLGKNRAISLFCRLCKHSTGATVECTHMLCALAICEGTVGTRICGIARFMNWLQSVNPSTNKKFLCHGFIFTDIHWPYEMLDKMSGSVPKSSELPCCLLPTYSRQMPFKTAC